ncbi:MAG TPA: caspase family protein [Methylomirabilota bacterium]|nr:caspase family protein [Methylomirabilota bacterium]
MAKKAVLIGINRYRIPGADLRGCVNDVNNMKAVLTQLYGFAGKDIVILTDYAATTKALQAAISKLVKGAKAGDVLFLHYSGHGSNVPDNDGDEADHRDEILCPTDLDWKKPLTDDWLRQTFNRLPAGVSLTVVMDCCHSGTNTRVIQQPGAERVQRFLPSPWDLVAAESGRKLRGKVRGTVRASAPAQRRKRDVVTVDIPEVLIAGCRDTQTSADAYIGGSYNGALTYCMVETLRAGAGNLTYRQLHQGTIKRLKQGKYDQVPQLEGRAENLDKPFLSST